MVQPPMLVSTAIAAPITAARTVRGLPETRV
jgi:hypothetical protein